MATTFLELANRVIRRIGEVELSTTSGQRGIAAFVLDSVNDSIRQINSTEQEWPFNYVAQTQDLFSGVSSYALDTDIATVDWESFFLHPVELVSNGTFPTDIVGWTDLSSGTGAISYSSTGNGRLNMNAGASGVAAAQQAIATATGIHYRLQTKTYGGTITLKVGSTSGGTDIISKALVMTHLNRGTYNEFYFTAAGTVTYIEFTHSDNASYQVDTIAVREDFDSVKLTYVDYDYYQEFLRANDFNRTVGSYDRPVYVTRLQDGTFAVSPTPKLEYRVEFDSWEYPAALVDSTDETNIPDKYTNVIVDRSLYECYMFKEDFEQAGIAKQRFKDGISEMRTQLINKPQQMKGTLYGI